MVTWDDFEKIWASTSPLTPYEFSDPNYSQGWNFVGSTPPARQMWDSIQKKNDEKFKYLRDNFGTPNIVTSSSQMTDTDKVYVYMGSEAGWNSGHWYYYNEGTSSWEDGGVYNSVAFVTDTTLSIAGQPADAKAVGDALALKADLAGCTFTGNVNVSADLSVTGTSTLAGDVTASSDLSVVGDSALTNLSVSGTTALVGTSTAPTPSADDNSTKIATTEYVQKEIKPIETDVTINDKRISNIEKLLQGNLYDYQTDSTSAYTKIVPSGAMPYAGLESLGGKTIVWNQLAPAIDSTRWLSGTGTTLSFSDGVGTFTAGGKYGIVYAKFGYSVFPITGHVYYIKGTFKIPQTQDSPILLDVGNFAYGSSLRINLKDSIVADTWFTVSKIATYSISASINAGLYITDGASSDWQTIQFKNIMLIDLTLLFGAGNEPSTVEEFQQMFPADYYAYNAGTLLSAGVTEVVSKDSNNTTLQTIPIPTAIRNLEGYGWSAGSVYNYVDFERKVFVQNVARVDLGSLTWTYESANTRFSANTPADATSSCPSGIPCVCAKYESYKNRQVAFASADKAVIVNSSYHHNGTIFVKDSAYTDATTFTTAMSGVYLYYELDTPVEVDISEYLTDDNLINVESGGTLTFPNQNGTDYQIPVPSEETYMIDLQSAIGG